ncbi:MAG: hypothetical protein LC808_21225, partial [Actinobacteria bacterium]|nr:hypothetical protein [Actinomycetota bacterium]
AENTGEVGIARIAPIVDPLQPHELTISSVRESAAPDGGRVFTVTGSQSIRRIDEGFIHIIGRPVNVQPVQRSYDWYASKPASLGSNDSWVASLEIDPSERRDIVVQAVFTLDITGICDNCSVTNFPYTVSYPVLASIPD